MSRVILSNHYQDYQVCIVTSYSGMYPITKAIGKVPIDELT